MSSHFFNNYRKKQRDDSYAKFTLNIRLVGSVINENVYMVKWKISRIQKQAIR